MCNKNDWYGYISKMETDFYIKEKNIFNTERFNYRLKVFFKDLELRKKVKALEFQGKIIEVTDNNIIISENLYFPHKNFKTILDIPVNINENNTNNTVKLIFDNNTINEKIFNITNPVLKNNKISVEIIGENNIDSYLCIKSDKCFYVEKSVCNKDKITKQLCKYPAHELLIKNDNNVLDICVYDDKEEKVFIFQNRFISKDYYIFKWETGALWMDLINIVNIHKKIKILFTNERSDDIDEIKSLLDSKDVCYIFEKITY